MNKFIQSFIETNWLTDDDDDDGDDDDGDGVGDRDGVASASEMDKLPQWQWQQAQHAQLVNLVAAYVLHFKSCVWAGQICPSTSAYHSFPLSPSQLRVNFAAIRFILSLERAGETGLAA